jgi:hypothetical protein
MHNSIVGSTQTADDFIQTVKPLFRQRRKYRIITYSLCAALLIAYAANVIIFLVMLPLVFYYFNTLSRYEYALEKAVWGRFQDGLAPSAIHSTPGMLRSKQLYGVMGNLGYSHSYSLLAEGTYANRPVRLLAVNVTFHEPSSRSGYTRRYRVLEITTRQQFYQVFIDAKRNHQNWFATAMSVLSRSINKNQRLAVEGDVHKYFDIYVPKHDKSHSLVTLSPEKLLALRNYGTQFDVEFSGNKIYLISNDKIRNINDVLVYQESILKVLENIGTDVARTRSDNTNYLVVQTPVVFSGF